MRQKIVAIIVLSAVALIIFVQPLFRQPVYQSDVPSTKEMYERGLVKHLVETKFDIDYVEIRRRESATVPFTVMHHSHVWWEPVTVKDFRNTLTNYSPPNQEVMINGTLSYSPMSIQLWGDSSSRAYVKIFVPETILDETLNQTVKITASFQADVP